jgi:cytochrome c biogenesis protein ResB
LVAALTSIRLAIVLISYLIATGIAAGLIPQGLPSEYYAEHYPRFVARIIGRTGFSHYFGSMLFLVPAGIFFVNLSLCTVQRFTNERRKSARRHGPDILHVGIALLMLAAAISFAGKQTGYVRLARGDAVKLPGNRLLELSDFAYLAYPDGRPRDWISTVRLSSGPKILIDRYAIRVNHPLRLGLLSIYQANSETERVLMLRDASGVEHGLAQGEKTETGGTTLYLVDPGQAGSKARLRIQDALGSRMVDVGAGDTVEGLAVVGAKDVPLSGLEAVFDPGYPFVLASLMIAGFGVFLTFLQKNRDMGAADA